MGEKKKIHEVRTQNPSQKGIFNLQIPQVTDAAHNPETY